MTSGQHNAAVLAAAWPGTEAPWSAEDVPNLNPEQGERSMEIPTFHPPIRPPMARRVAMKWCLAHTRYRTHCEVVAYQRDLRAQYGWSKAQIRRNGDIWFWVPATAEIVDRYRRAARC